MWIGKNNMETLSLDQQERVQKLSKDDNYKYWLGGFNVFLINILEKYL
jgi:hypothetical protein